MLYANGNLGPGLRQAQICGRIKSDLIKIFTSRSYARFSDINENICQITSAVFVFSC
jgi:hypothetical protein